MQAGLPADEPAAGAHRLGPAFIVAAAAAALWLARPLVLAYGGRLAAGHGIAPVAAVAFAALAAGALMWLAVLRHPAAAGWALAAFAALTATLSGNLATAAAAAAILAATLSAGDLVFRALRGEDAGPGDLTATLAAGFVAIGLAVVVMGLVGAFTGATLAAVLAAAVLARPRRLRVLALRIAAGARWPRGDSPRALEAAWLAFSALVFAALWVGALCPDVSWDGLAYHLPEIRDIVRSGAVRPLAELAPQSLLWRNHDAYLAAGFAFGGEAVARLLQFAVGAAVFGAALSLARRIGAAGSGPLVVLLLCAFPTAMLQLRATYADWPAALFVTAAAAELAAAPGTRRRGLLAGFLFGGAIAVKVFAALAAPALLWLLLRQRPRGRSMTAALGGLLLALAPWFLWNARGQVPLAAAYGANPFTTSPASGAAASPVPWTRRAERFARLPYDLVFHSSRFEANNDGYNGVLALVALAGLAGWDKPARRVFAAVTLPVVLAWSQLYLPSVRYLFPLYPLYGVFAAEGLRRLAGRFDGTGGRAAGLALLAAAAAFPVQFGSSGLEWQVALGRRTREQFREARLSAAALWRRLGPADRVVLLGENDRFGCPAETAWRDDYRPVSDWGRDPAAWRRGLDALRITAVVYREDRRSDDALLASLADRLEPAGRAGPARLYLVRPAGGAVSGVR